MFRAVWTIYISFYTVFLTFTGFAFGWFVGGFGGNPNASHPPRAVIFIIILQSIQTATTSASLTLYSRKVKEDYEKTEELLLGDSQLLGKLYWCSPFPVQLATWAGYANAFAMLLTTSGWIYLVFWWK